MVIKNIKYQKGMTLMELLIAGFISIIASSGMLILMANTLSTGAQTIKTTQLANEMRSSMQFITRELRRANYHSTFAACFGNPECTTSMGDYINSVSEVGKGMGISDTSWGTNDCLWFWYDRDATKDFGNSEEPVAAFRRAENNGVGIIQMTILRTDSAELICAAAWNDAEWVDVTDSNLVNVTALEIDNSISISAEYDKSILYSFLDSATVDSYPFTFSGSTQAIERIGITMTGTRIDNAAPAWMQGDDSPTVVLQDFIQVRNNTIRSAP